MKVARRVLRGPRRSNAPGLPDGATADRVFALGDDGDLDQQAAYTALSRGRIENRLYMLEPDEDLQALLDGHDTPEREPLVAHAEQELSRDRSQPRASDFAATHAAELLASLPEPEGPAVTGRAADLLAQLPDPVGRPARRNLADELLDSLPRTRRPRHRPDHRSTRPAPTAPGARARRRSRNGPGVATCRTQGRCGQKAPTPTRPRQTAARCTRPSNALARCEKLQVCRHH